MADRPDQNFYARADAHIHLSNDQKKLATGGEVSASMMYGTARYNAWISATGHANGADMASKKAETIAYFLREYQAMLEENFDDYVANFDAFMKPRP